MSKTGNDVYRQRLTRVIDYIVDHLDEDLSVTRLSQVAHFSKFHFHRQFSNSMGITVFKLVQILRLRQAAYQLVYHANDSILDIALKARFEHSESFSRAFKKAFGQTPSGFRKQPLQQPWLEKFVIPSNQGQYPMNVNILDFPETQVAALEHRKSPRRVNDTVDTFIQWRKENGYSPANSKTFGIIYDDPESVPPEAFRFDLCGEISREVSDNPYGIIPKTIPAGRCAVLRHTGALKQIDEAVRYLYSQWLAGSGEALRDFPCFFHYVKPPSEVPENQLITDIYLPLV